MCLAELLVVMLLPVALAALVALPVQAGWPPPQRPAFSPEISPQPGSLLIPIQGRQQTLPLSCESRSAADWSTYFGVQIDELDFQDQLPRSDNPEKGYAGDVNGVWGKTPPDSYGVHAGPVAELLRSYGLPARARRGMTLVEVKEEIAAGRPVIVWVVGHVENGSAKTYRALDGEEVTVAPREHTVIAVGYTGETVIVLDGKFVYGRATAHFIHSWSVLGNMAVVFDITAGPEDEQIRSIE